MHKVTKQEIDKAANTIQDTLCPSAGPAIMTELAKEVALKVLQEYEAHRHLSSDIIFTAMPLEPVEVTFKKPIFEDDFPEAGMKAFFMGAEVDKGHNCWKLYFDFAPFEEHNARFFKHAYYDSNSVPCLTAIEAGMYEPKYSVYVGELGDEKSFHDMVSEFIAAVPTA